MNRRKKINSIHKQRAKKANAKKAPPSNKPRYISKAERAAMEAAESADVATSTPDAVS